MSIDAKKNEHQRFLELTEDFYRQSGCPLDFFESGPGEPIAFDAKVGEVKFSVGYDPDGAPACLFVYCIFGEVPASNEAPVLRRLLELNLAQSREHGGTFCLDSETREVAYYLRARATGIDAAGLRDELARVARIASQWREDCFLGDIGEDGEPQVPASEESNAWALFA